MKKLKIISLLTGMFVLSVIHLAAQSDSIQYEAQIGGVVSTGDYAPFWIQNNQYGTVSLSPFSQSLKLGIYKDFTKNKTFDYAFKAEALQIYSEAQKEIYFHQLYAEARWHSVHVRIGSKEETYGNQDADLSLGGMLFSENTRPMPQIYAGIPEFTTVPLTFGYMEIKGGISQGWFMDNVYMEDVLLHHKYAYIRLGGKLPVKVQYGFDHVAQWGGTTDASQPYKPSLSDFVDVFFAKGGGSDANVNEQINTLGNHILSQSMKLEVNAGNYEFAAYWQNISEDPPLRFITATMNVPDGLWGFSIKNHSLPFVKGFLYEYLNTTDQSGPYHDRDGIVFGGNDSYYENYLYRSGWTYYSRTIGNPLLTSPIYNANGSISIQNSRVQAHHFGLEGDVAGYEYKIMTTISKNYGRYSAPYSPMKPNTSFYLNIQKDLPTFYNIHVDLTAGVDRGNMYGNNLGFMFRVSKTGNILKY